MANETQSKVGERPRAQVAPLPLDSSFSGGGWPFSVAVLVLLLVFGFILYGNTLDSEFHLDDYPNLLENPAAQMTSLSWESLRAALTTPVGGNRPVASLLFALNFYSGQFNVRGYHMTSLLVHILAGWMLYLFLLETLRSAARGRSEGVKPHLLALVATLLWFAHPIQTQAVTYIIQRTSALAGVFYLLALFLYARLRLRPHGGRARLLHWVGIVLAGLLALGSKETSATLPFVILLYEFFFVRRLRFAEIRGKAFYLVGIVLAPALIVLADYWRFGVSFFERMSFVYQLRGMTLGERVLTEFRVIVRYITLLILPLPSRLNLEHDVTVSRGLFNPPTTLFSLLLILGLLALAVHQLRRRPLVSFFTFWFFIQLAIESSVIPLELMFEHRLYLPSVSLGVIAVALLFLRPVSLSAPAALPVAMPAAALAVPAAPAVAPPAGTPETAAGESGAQATGQRLPELPPLPADDAAKEER